MKFALYLASHLTPEWQSQYVNYDRMKTMIYESKSYANNVDLEENLSHNSSIKSKFLRFCECELNKVNVFYLEKNAEAKRKFECLRTEIDNPLEDSNSIFFKRYKNRRKSRLRTALSELYLLLILIQNYQSLNYTAFRKILKKFDKEMLTSDGHYWFTENVENANFYSNRDIDNLIEGVELIFTDKLENGNKSKAMQRLRVLPLEEKEKSGTIFRVGMFMGIILILLPGWLLVSQLLQNTQNLFVPWKPVFHLYRSFLILIIHTILLSVNVYGWNKAGINHVLIFEIDPRNHLTYQQILEISSFIAIVLLFSVISFMVCYHFALYPFINPLIFVSFVIAFLLNPINILQRSARFWLIKRIFRMCTAPFCHVHFADFWVGDQFISLTLPFVDAYYFVCFYARAYNWKTNSFTDKTCGNNALAAALLISVPSWFRFWQCIRRYYDSKLVYPHLYNAGKYSTTFVSALITYLYVINQSLYNSVASNPYFYLYIVSLAIESTYKCVWDIKVDWGLFAGGKYDSISRKILRNQLIYPSKSVYYLAIFQNIVIRYMWPIGILIDLRFSENFAELFTFVNAMLEMIRRHIWNYFRLENEHLNNVGLFRAVRDISILPIKRIDRLLKGLANKTQGRHHYDSEDSSI